MKEFMLLIRNKGDHQKTWTPEVHREFLKKCESYIAGLTNARKLIAAQPLIREGKVIAGTRGAFHETSFDPTKEVQVGYYHIYANDLEEAIAIAKGNPEFEYTTTASIEVRPIKVKEVQTGFVYPEKK